MYAVLRIFYAFFVHFCTASAYVCVRFLRTLYGFFVRIRLFFRASCATFAFVYGFLCALSGFCVRIWLFVRYERILLTHTAFWFLESLGDTILRVLWFGESLDDPILRVRWFVGNTDDPILRVLWFIESHDDPILRVVLFIEIPYERLWWLGRM